MRPNNVSPDFPLEVKDFALGLAGYVARTMAMLPSDDRQRRLAVGGRLYLRAPFEVKRHIENHLKRFGLEGYPHAVNLVA